MGEDWTVTVNLMALSVPLAVGYFFYWRYKRSRLYELAEKIPGPEGYPLIGNAHHYLGKPETIFETLMKFSRQYENVVKMWVGPRLFVFLTHPADVELILSSHDHIDKSPEYRFFQPWLGNGLLISTGEKWRVHRKLIAPAFHLNVLKSFFNLFNRNSKAVVERLKDQVDKEIDCHDFMSEATVEILLETVMGVSKKMQSSGYDYAMAVMKMCDILHLRQTKLWYRPEIIFWLSKYNGMQKKLLSVIHGLTRKVLKIRKDIYTRNGGSFEGVTKDDEVDLKTTEKSDFSFGSSKTIKDDIDEDIGEKKRLPFLDLLIENSENGVILTDEEIQNQVDTIMFEGHDTTAAGSSFFLCMLAARQDIQEKCIAEIDGIFGDSDRDVTFQDTLEMKYLERCIMETLRLFPPVPAIARELKEELKLASTDLSIPANCTVIIGTFKLHRREDIYKDPEEFNPDNFLPENSSQRHYYSFIPFSAGPRSCVGRKYAMLKLKVLLSTLLRNFRVKKGLDPKNWVLQADIILKRSDGFKIQLESRKSKA